MFIFRTSRMFESKVIPGLKFTIQKMTESRRADLMLAQAGAMARYDVLMERARLLKDTATKEYQEVLSEIDGINRFELTPIKIRWAVAEMNDQLNLEGIGVATLQNLADWPYEVITELSNEIERGNALGDTQAKNSE